MAGSVTLSVVVPMFNEERGISKTVGSLSRALAGLGVSWELIVVNDGSTDGGAEVVASLQEGEKRLHLVSYPQNRGRGYALRQGFSRARGSYVIATEADLSWGAEVVPKIFAPLAEGRSDVVVATPYLPGGGLRNVPWHRHLLSAFGNRVLGFALGGRVTMASGMTRGYRREVLENLDLESDGKEIHLEILSKVLTLGYSVSEVPSFLTWEESEKKARSGRSTFKLWRFVVSHLLFSFEEHPFLLFGSIGGLFLLAGTAFGLWSLVLSLRGHPMGNRPLTLGSVLMILFGLQIVIFSFLALQNRNLAKKMVRLSAQLKSRPPGEGESRGTDRSEVSP